MWCCFGYCSTFASRKNLGSTSSFTLVMSNSSTSCRISFLPSGLKFYTWAFKPPLLLLPLSLSFLPFLLFCANHAWSNCTFIQKSPSSPWSSPKDDRDVPSKENMELRRENIELREQTTGLLEIERAMSHKIQDLEVCWSHSALFIFFLNLVSSDLRCFSTVLYSPTWLIFTPKFPASCIFHDPTFSRCKYSPVMQNSRTCRT